jgi:hypothetical protein
LQVRLSTIIAILFVGFNSYGQNVTVFGTILDQQNNEPIELVSIIAEEFSVTTQTAQDGSFRIKYSS